MSSSCVSDLFSVISQSGNLFLCDMIHFFIETGDDPWYTKLAKKQCEEIELREQKEMKRKEQRLKAVQTKMKAYFQLQQRQMELSSQRYGKQFDKAPCRVLHVYTVIISFCIIGSLVMLL